jgi:nucleoid-associated protein YgaU
MTLQISMLEETVQRLHVRLQRHIRALYVLHANGNDEAALIALDRISQINTKIAELNALLDSFEQPQTEAEIIRELAEAPPAATGAELVDRLNETPLEPLVQDVVIDDPDQDDLDMEYRGAVYMTAAIVLLIGLAIFFFPRMTSLFDNFAEQAVQEPVTQVVEAPPLVKDIIIEDVAITDITYTVQKGDTLWSIAKQMYGDPNQWATIYGQNVEVIGDNADLIFPGQVLTVTKVSTGTVPVG